MTRLFPIVNEGKVGGFGCASGIVLVPITTFLVEGSRLIGVPDMVMAGAPGVIVWPFTTYCEALSGVMTSLPKVNDGKADGSGSLSGTVWVPITTFFAEGARLIGVPDMVTAGAPGVIVWPLTIYCDALLAVTISLPTVKPWFCVGSGLENGTGGALGGSLPMFCDDPRPRPWFVGSELRSGWPATCTLAELSALGRLTPLAMAPGSSSRGTVS